MTAETREMAVKKARQPISSGNDMPTPQLKPRSMDAATQRLPLVTVGEFLESHQEVPPWVVKPLLTEGSVGMLYGHQGRGKSSILFQLAVSVARGEAWLGFVVEKPGPVILLETDMDQRENKLLLMRAGEAGLLDGVADRIWLPPVQPDFNILQPPDYNALRAWCADLEPSLVILDTADAGFYSPRESNSLIKRVLTRYRSAVEPAAFMFAHHDRKKRKSDFADNNSDDTQEDSFLGWGQWERSPTATSIQLALTKNDGYCLRFQKHRIGNPGFKTLRLEKDDQGFFKLKDASKVMLISWPDCLPPNERTAALAKVTSQRDVFHEIAERTHTKFETVKSQFQRGRERGADYPWLKLLK